MDMIADFLVHDLDFQEVVGMNDLRSEEFFEAVREFKEEATNVF